MAATTSDEGGRPARLGFRAKAIILACAAAAYALQFQPAQAVLGFGLKALGNPPYEGFRGMFLPHLLLYSTFTAFACAVLWLILNRARLLPAPALGPGRRTLAWGLLGAVAGIALTLAAVSVWGPPGSVGWIEPNGWKIAGNLFSNFYEGFIFRGFMLVALTAVFGFWPAAVLSGAMWGFQHTQYPLWLQLTIMTLGVVWCWVAQRAGSLWAPYLSHTGLDTVMDSLVA